MLTLDNVSFRYHGTSNLVLKDVSIQVERGETIALMGPSGSGKSTALALIGLLDFPTNGTISFDGVIAPHNRTDREKFRNSAISWILQGSNLLGNRTATDNVALRLLARGWSRNDATEESRRLLQQVDLADKTQSLTEQLSGGEAQRVSVARALGDNPMIVLADEPTGQLDATTTQTVLAALLKSALSGVLIIATHDPIVAEGCSRTIQLSDGKLL